MAPEACRPLLADVIGKLEKRLVLLKKDVAISHITYERARRNNAIEEEVAGGVGQKQK